MTVTEPVDQDRTLTFPNVVAKRLAEVAIRSEQAWMETRRAVEGMVGIGRREHVGRIVELYDETYVVEVIDRSPVIWRVVVGGRLDYRGVYTLDEALLLAVELRNGGTGNGHVYVARMLGAGAKPAEEAAR